MSSGFDERRDVGFLELERDEAAALGTEFLEPARILRNCSHAPGGIILQGCPSSLTSLQPETVELVAVSFGRMTVEPATVEGASPAIDIVIDYGGDFVDVDSREVCQEISPPGLSGGGIWRVPTTPKSVLWSAQPVQLIGLQRGFRQSSPRLLRATQIQHWLDLIAADYPELREVISHAPSA